MTFRAKILIFLKEGVLDTQGKTVAKSLQQLGYASLRNARVGKYIQLWIDADSREEARKQADSMCDDLLVNDLIEDYSIQLEEE